MLFDPVDPNRPGDHGGNCSSAGPTQRRPTPPAGGGREMPASSALGRNRHGCFGSGQGHYFAARGTRRQMVQKEDPLAARKRMLQERGHLGGIQMGPYG